MRSWIPVRTALQVFYNLLAFSEPVENERCKWKLSGRVWAHKQQADTHGQGMKTEDGMCESKGLYFTAFGRLLCTFKRLLWTLILFLWFGLWFLIKLIFETEYFISFKILHMYLEWVVNHILRLSLLLLKL